MWDGPKDVLQRIILCHQIISTAALLECVSDFLHSDLRSLACLTFIPIQSHNNTEYVSRCYTRDVFCAKMMKFLATTLALRWRLCSIIFCDMSFVKTCPVSYETIFFVEYWGSVFTKKIALYDTGEKCILFWVQKVLFNHDKFHQIICWAHRRQSEVTLRYAFLSETFWWRSYQYWK